MAEGLTTYQDPTRREDLEGKKPKFNKATYWMQKRMKKSKKKKKGKKNG